MYENTVPFAYHYLLQNNIKRIFIKMFNQMDVDQISAELKREKKRKQKQTKKA